MNEYSINNKIKSTAFLIERDGLAQTTDVDEEIVALMLSFIARLKQNKIRIDNSEYDKEIAKVLKNLKMFFSEDIVARYLKEIESKSYLINCCTPPSIYYSSFIGEQFPEGIYIPKQLDTLSHVFIGHEVMHVLKEGHNKEEWHFLLVYSEVIPMFYELIQAEKSRYRSEIIKWRLNKLKEMYQNAYHPSVTHTLDKDNLKLYQMPENMYFLSFYYTLMLYSIYRESPKDILILVEKVLQKEMTTKELLEYLGVFNHIDETMFENVSKQLLLVR